MPHSNTDTDTITETDSMVIRMSAWDQVGMRAFMRVVLCFPFDDNARPAAKEHIKASLQRLAQQRPDFAGTTEVDDGGHVYQRTRRTAMSKKGAIPFFAADIASLFPYSSYKELKEAEFPPAAFVGAHFNHTYVMDKGQPGVPVAVVKAFFIPGGLFLGVFFNHAMADGDCLRIFLEAFSGQTRSMPADGASTKQLCIPGLLSLSSSSSSSSSPNQQTVPDTLNGSEISSALLDRIPEFVVLDKPTGPTVPQFRPGGVPMDQIAKMGKIFVFKSAALEKLRSSLLSTGAQASTETTDGDDACAAAANGPALAGQGAVTKYTCLAGLAWTHIARARLADPNRYVPRDEEADGVALLQTMVNWKSRAFQAENPDYFGNATAVAVTRVPTEGLLGAAATDRLRMAELVRSIAQTIAGVDEAYVRDRTELFMRVSDPRLIGLRFDPRTPQDLGFNTWRHFGADFQWAIPGVTATDGSIGSGSAATAKAIDTTSPDAIRRTQDAWNMSGALILPAKASSDVHELLVTLPQTSMDLLCQDQDWMRWVDRVIG